MPAIGIRIGAILGETDTKISFLGYGTYEGYFLPPWVSVPTFEEIRDQIGTVQGMAEPLLRQLYAKDFSDGGLMWRVRCSARLRLDNGDIVWGKECSWDHELHIRRRLHGKVIVNVRLARDDSGRAIGVIEL